MMQVMIQPPSLKFGEVCFQVNRRASANTASLIVESAVSPLNRGHEDEEAHSRNELQLK